MRWALVLALNSIHGAPRRASFKKGFMRETEELKKTTNRTAYKKLYKSVVCNKDGRCSYCPWHNKENGDGVYKKYGTRKAKNKQISHVKITRIEFPDDDIKYVMGQFDDSDE